MTNLKKATIAALAALALYPAVASAAPSNQDHAIDKQGRPILDARGNCVLTKWMVRDAGCYTRVGTEARTVYFDFNKSTIRASEKKKLDALVRTIKSSRDVSDVDVVGHADKIGTSSYNRALSRKRAEAVRSYLVKNGVKIRKIDIRAVGEDQSVTRCDPKMPRKEMIACLAEDRRVTVELNYRK